MTHNHRMGEYYKVDIRSGSLALVNRLAFDGATKRNKPELQRGPIPSHGRKQISHQRHWIYYSKSSLLPKCASRIEMPLIISYCLFLQCHYNSLESLASLATISHHSKNWKIFPLRTSSNISAHVYVHIGSVLFCRVILDHKDCDTELTCTSAAATAMWVYSTFCIVNGASTKIYISIFFFPSQHLFVSVLHGEKRSEVTGDWNELWFCSRICFLSLLFCNRSTDRCTHLY